MAISSIFVSRILAQDLNSFFMRSGRDEPVDQPSRDAYLSWNGRQFFRIEPAGLDDLCFVDFDLATNIFSGKTDHQGIGKRLWLAVEIADVSDFDAHLFLNFTMNRIFQGFTRFHKTGQDAVKIRSESI